MSATHARAVASGPSRRRPTRLQATLAAALAVLAACAAPPRTGPPPDAVWRAPFAVPNNSFFHAALEVPPLQGAQLLEQDQTVLQLRSDHADSHQSGTDDGVPQEFTGRFEEWAVLTLRRGLPDGWEGGLRVPLSGWNEDRDVFSLVDAGGGALVEEEQGVLDGTSASERHLGFGEVVLEARRTLPSDSPWTLAGQGVLKVPIGRPRNLTNAGTWDLSLALLASRAPDAPDGATWHVNAGAGAPFGSQTLFVSGSPADVVPFLFAGAGVLVPLGDATLLGVQLEGHTSAFRHVPLMDGTPVTLFAGLRTLAGPWILEAGLGTGLDDSAYDWSVHLGATRVL